jgi:peptidyl-prolyl cis-trans isomerase SurA
LDTSAIDRISMRIFRTFLVLAGIASVSPLQAQDRQLSDRGELLDGVAAIVNDGIVLRSELRIEIDRIVKRLSAQGTPTPPERTLAKQVLERLVINRIELQRAERVGIQVSDETLNSALANIAQRNSISLAQLPDMLAKEGIDYQSYRSEMRDQIVMEQLRQRDVLAKIIVTPREVDEYLAREAGKPGLNQEYQISQILVAISPAATPEQVAAAEKKIDDIARRLKNGEDFAKLAVAYSDGQQALEGGSLGWRKGQELPTLFADLVPGLQKGQVSEPVRSASGFHLVKLDDRRGGEPIVEQQTHVRHILVTTTAILDDDAARQKLLAIRERIAKGDDFAAVAKAASEDPGSAKEGGDLGWMSVGGFAPEFQAVCDKLQVDELSEPFKSRFGWHIVQLLGRRMQDTTEETKRQQAAIAVRNSKLGEETEIWMRRLRDQAFVDYRI